MMKEFNKTTKTLINESVKVVKADKNTIDFSYLEDLEGTEIMLLIYTATGASNKARYEIAKAVYYLQTEKGMTLLEIEKALKGSYLELKENALKQYSATINKMIALGFSFDSAPELFKLVNVSEACKAYERALQQGKKIDFYKIATTKNVVDIKKLYRDETSANNAGKDSKDGADVDNDATATTDATGADVDNIIRVTDADGNAYDVPADVLAQYKVENE